MIHVRRHTRQLGSGKTVKVTEHERAGSAAESAGITGPSGQNDGWWDHPAQAEDVSMADHPDGTWYFRQGDDLMAVHPDGTVHPAAGEADDEPDATPVSDHPAGTWYFSDEGKKYAVYPDSSTHLVAAEPPEPTSTLGRMQANMRDWRSRDIHVPPGQVDNSPLGRALGNDTQEGADNFARLKAYREAGYDGPLDQDNRIPDPDDPANHESLSALARMSEIRRRPATRFTPGRAG